MKEDCFVFIEIRVCKISSFMHATSITRNFQKQTFASNEHEATLLGKQRKFLIVGDSHLNNIKLIISYFNDNRLDVLF